MIFATIAVGPLGTNSYILGCPETGVGVVIDPGSEPERILTEVKRLNLTIKYIINTHGHFDHVGGNRRIVEATGAQLLIHSDDAPMLDRAAKVATMYGTSSENSPQPNAFLEDGQLIAFGKEELKVLHTPGHTPGGCSLYSAKQGVAITGDTLFAESVGRTDFPGSSHAALMAGIKGKLMTLPDTTKVYPGHGPSSTIGHERKHNPYLVQ